MLFLLYHIYTTADYAILFHTFNVLHYTDFTILYTYTILYYIILYYTTLHFTTLACRGNTHYIVQQILQYNVVLPVYGEHF